MDQGAPTSPNPKAVSLFVSNRLSQMEEDFQKSGDSIMDRMRAMGSKMDGLEQSISDLLHDVGLDEVGSEGNTIVSSSPTR
mmetsp:Transcript_20054/g.41310  ORF Transcript_20054/g.41310 Transcript_20054/m.41310 type:complete len:81 (-) Transcript_20054:449-691(-)|eukprot:CAMPEP_0197264576 /NCGR_PEP_ID=MMETSP1432-20130617/1873_1 /TAXON_ID=44447 /ORGANISM="Pseudo-nitzschia delicatissima, Strain UNC1205" /LENGTH=80 /DNA_ID=CAMNT_0042729227 /DNA_START=71 /DNA_END=313 /DNA_ORIENTATION=+